MLETATRAQLIHGARGLVAPLQPGTAGLTRKRLPSCSDRGLDHALEIERNLRPLERVAGGVETVHQLLLEDQVEERAELSLLDLGSAPVLHRLMPSLAF